MLEALDVNDVRNYPSRASSPGEAPTIKVEGQPSQGVPVTPKRKNDVFDVGRKASTGVETRRSGLASRMLNRLAYLSGRNSDIIHHLYGERRGTAVLHQMARDHATTEYNITGDPNDPGHGKDPDKPGSHGGNSPPRGRHPGGGGPPRGERQGGDPPRNDPDNSDPGEDDEDEESEDNIRGNPPEHPHAHGLGAQRNYLRGYTPGNTRYWDPMQERYARRIDEQVGQPTGPLGPEIKVMNPPKPSKYGGQDNLEKFDDWVSQLLKYYCMFKITGLDQDED